VFCAKFLGLPVLGVRILGIALRGEDNGQILVGQRIARIELNGLPVLGDRLRGLGRTRDFFLGWPNSVRLSGGAGAVLGAIFNVEA
jgi:hypothetical protein